MLIESVGTVPGATVLDDEDPEVLDDVLPLDDELPPGDIDSVSTTNMRGRWASWCRKSSASKNVPLPDSVIDICDGAAAALAEAVPCEDVAACGSPGDIPRNWNPELFEAASISRISCARAGFEGTAAVTRDSVCRSAEIDFAAERSWANCAESDASRATTAA